MHRCHAERSFEDLIEKERADRVSQLVRELAKLGDIYDDDAPFANQPLDIETTFCHAQHPADLRGRVDRIETVASTLQNAGTLRPSGVEDLQPAATELIRQFAEDCFVFIAAGMEQILADRDW